MEHREQFRALQKSWRKTHPGQGGRYRALKKAAHVEPVNFNEIYERDKGICGVCHRKVTRAAASLDHIQPISKGGAHASWNVRITHLKCNLGRGNRGAAQLRIAIA